MNISIKSTEEMEKFAMVFTKEIAKKGKKAFVVGLQGDLGSGKTTFTKSVASAFGVEGTVTSPTFVIEKIYKLPENSKFSKMVHIDAYRLDTDEELRYLGWEDIIKDPENIIFVEWPEKVKGVLPEDMHLMKFNFVDENTREVEY